MHKHGETNIETSLCYYEYGNALFRAVNRRMMDNDGINNDDGKEIKTKKISSSETTSLAVTASSRINKNKFYGKKDNDTSNEKITTKDEHEKEDNGGDNSDDLQLSLELMENAWSILDEHYNETTKTNTKYKHWIENQIPRYLIGIGEILSIQKRHADAVDAYTRALPYRESSIQNKKEDKSIEYLRQRRLFTEVNVLIAEELLVCYNENSDIITYETKSILVKKEERIDFIQGYYDKGRDELQETGKCK